MQTSFPSIWVSIRGLGNWNSWQSAVLPDKPPRDWRTDRRGIVSDHLSVHDGRRARQIPRERRVDSGSRRSDAEGYERGRHRSPHYERTDTDFRTERQQFSGKPSLARRADSATFLLMVLHR
jgi:hypothetical protein